MSTSFSSIPLVDLARLRNPATKKTELAVLRDSIFNVGFLYLINNGVEVRGSPLASSPSDDMNKTILLVLTYGLRR